jgi:isopenicillin N synthase-like dioxygenase
MVPQTIPIVDFANFKSDPKKVAQDVMEACKSIGFFYMINHDIPAADIDRAFELVIY